MRLIDEKGNQVGVVEIAEALEKATDAGLDLIEIAPNVSPPVCKILDYGKYKYEISKKEKESRKKQHTIVVKEIRMRPKIDKNDMETKARHARKFIEQGDRVKVSMVFRGREMMHMEIGRGLMQDFQSSLEDVARIDVPLSREGNTLVTVLSKNS